MTWLPSVLVTMVRRLGSKTPVGPRAEQVWGDGEGFGAVFVAVDVQRAADNQIDIAGQPAAGNETDAQGIDQCMLAR